MANYCLNWAYNASEDSSNISPTDCRQYLPPVPEDLAEKLSGNSLTPKIMNALRWNDMVPKDLEATFPDSQSLISLMVEIDMVRLDRGMFSLNEAYYDYLVPMDADEFYWYLVSEKREWGLFLKDIIESLALRLIANKFGTSCNSMDVMDLDLNLSNEKMTEAGNRLFGVLASLLTDEDPESLFERWTKVVHRKCNRSGTRPMLVGAAP